MILKVNSNPNFTLTLKLDIDYEIEAINILVILQNTKNGKKEMNCYHGGELKKALARYSQYEQFIF